jgi:serine/threonine kinase 38
MNGSELKQLLKEGKISSKTYEKVAIAKSYIEKKYSLKKEKEVEQKKNWEIFNKKINEMNLSEKEKEMIKKDILHKEAEIFRSKYSKLN